MDDHIYVDNNDEKPDVEGSTSATPAGCFSWTFRCSANTPHWRLTTWTHCTSQRVYLRSRRVVLFQSD